MKTVICCLLAGLLGSGVSTSAVAEGIASEGKSLGGKTDGQCLDRAEEMIAVEEASSTTFSHVVRGDYTRRIVYTDGSVDFICFPDKVVITIYFSSAGNGMAGADLRTFLEAF